MLKPFFRASMAALVAFAFGLQAIPASADSGQPLSGVVSGANTAIRSLMSSSPVAQVPPINQQPVGGKQELGLPTGFTYFLDASVAFPFGNIGSYGKHWLPSGIDAMGAYGFNPQERLVASYYELQHYPVGFNSGQVGLNLPPGFPPSVANPACVDLSGTTSATCGGIASPINVTTKDRFLLLSFEQLITIGTMKHRPIPVVITPTFVSRWSQVGGSPFANSDVVPFVDQNGAPHTDIHTRTAQYDSIAVTFPFLKTPKMFGTLTLAPTVLSHLNGVNQQNAVQLYQILYLEYNLNKDTRFFFEPQASRDYLPTDAYAQHLNAIFLGATRRIGKDGFVQVVYNTGGPTNYGSAGVHYLQCYALPCSANTLPAVGALRASQIQLQIGIGSPVVLPF
jgi:hypothetical protein